MAEKVQKTEAEWRKALTPEQFEVARKKGTERAFTGAYWDNHDQGVYRCVCCDAELFRSYLAAWGDKNAYAVSHVGFGLNPKARYEALTMYDQRDTNGTEIRAVAGNFLFSTGANEFAGRYTAGHFDLPVMRTTITVDGNVVLKEGVVQNL